MRYFLVFVAFLAILLLWYLHGSPIAGTIILTIFSGLIPDRYLKFHSWLVILEPLQTFFSFIYGVGGNA